MRFDRRKFLVCSVQLPLAMAASKAAAACLDPDELSDSEQSKRDSLDYTDKAPDSKQACRGCAFFNPEKAGAGCGNCEVLGGAVDAKGHCVSWTKRA
jgi:hypothetical protein